MRGRETATRLKAPSDTISSSSHLAQIERSDPRVKLGPFRVIRVTILEKAQRTVGQLQIPNLRVAGSNPAGVTTFKKQNQ
jgi:hypothetical protein